MGVRDLLNRFPSFQAPRQNQLNRGKLSIWNGKQTYSKFIGVTFDKNGKRIKRWIGRYADSIGKVHYKRFKTETEAAQFRDKFVREFHSEFAVLNQEIVT